MKFLTDDQINEFAQKGYILVDSWLPSSTLMKVHSEFVDLFRSGEFKKAQISDAASRTGITRGDWTYWLNNPPPALSNLERELKSWIPNLNQNFYCGVTDLEAHLAQYPEGPGYEKHIDQPKGKENRKITFVLYLNPHWSENDGGDLCLYGTDGQLLEKISPQGGRLVLFRSEVFPHEVLPCQRVRRSLTGWYRNDAV